MKLAAATLLFALMAAGWLFRYQVLDSPDGGVRSRYDRWTGQIEYAAPAAHDTFAIRWVTATDAMREARAKQVTEDAWKGMDWWKGAPIPASPVKR